METFSKGLVTDTIQKAQPQGSYRFALNAILETKEDGHGALSNELGNELCVSLPEGFAPIGHVLTDGDDIVIFATDNIESIIALFNPKTKTLNIIVQDTCLGFKDTHPIEALFRVRKGCNRTIYFTDNLNAYRYFDFDAVDTFKDADGNWDCNKFAFFPNVTVPRIVDTKVLDTGGSLKVGAYQFAIRYLDGDLNGTNYFYVTAPVNIYDDNVSSAYGVIDGGVNIVDSSEEIGSVPETGKSIELSITDLDDLYAYYQIAVIASLEGTGTASTVYVLPPQSIDSPTDTTTVADFTQAGTTITTVADIAVDNPVFDKVKSHAQVDNTLYIGGVSLKEYDWAEFQRAANAITVEYVVDQVEADSQYDEGNAKNPSTAFFNKTFMGDEIYAVSIKFLLPDGSFSPEFHIPGREKDDFDADELTVGVDIDASEVAHLGITSGTYER